MSAVRPLVARGDARCKFYSCIDHENALGFTPNTFYLVVGLTARSIIYAIKLLGGYYPVVRCRVHSISNFFKCSIQFSLENAQGAKYRLS